MSIDDTITSLDELLAALEDHWRCTCGAWHKIRRTANPFRVNCKCGAVSDVNTSPWPPTATTTTAAE